jgi:hypothetical protein
MPRRFRNWPTELLRLLLEHRLTPSPERPGLHAELEWRERMDHLRQSGALVAQPPAPLRRSTRFL